MIEHPTYRNRGNCPKCDYYQTALDWKEGDVWARGDAVDGGLYARCHQCGYEWKVKARDE